MTSSLLLEACSLSRHYGKHTAVADFSLELRQGEVLGLLGTNGAGKSTTLHMLCGLLTPDRGKIHIGGHDMSTAALAAKRQLGFLPEPPPLYTDLSVDEYLKFCTRLHGLDAKNGNSAIEKTKSKCGLESVGKRLIGNLSSGYQQRVGIAQAIIHEPPLIILDEPTSALDPVQIQQIRELIATLRGEHAIIIATHLLSEVQVLCNRVLILDRGHTILDQTMEQLRTSDDNQQKFRFTFGSAINIAQLENITGVANVEQLSSKSFVIEYSPGVEATREIVQTSLREHWQIYSITPEKESLESLFFRLVQGDKVISPDTIHSNG